MRPASGLGVMCSWNPGRSSDSGSLYGCHRGRRVWGPLPRDRTLNVVPPTRSPGPLSGKKESMVVPSSLNLNKPWPFPECLCKAKFKDTKMEMTLSVTLRGRLVTGPPLLP